MGALTIVICPNCQKNTPEGKFCEQCGAPLPVAPVQAPAPAFPQPQPPQAPPQAKKGMSTLGWVLVIFGILFLVIIFFAAVGIMAAPTPAITTKTTLTPTTTTGYSHTPSETLYGHVDNGGSYRITTTIRDPTTSLYSIRLVGPQNTDFDLYVQKGLDPTSHNYDYKSAGFSPSEQIDIPYPSVGDYHILVTSVGGSGDFVLYITYKYS